MSYSWLTSVYCKSNLKELEVALQSMRDQTLPAEQFVIVVDGPIPSELKSFLRELEEKDKDLYTIVYLSKNSGLGTALREGMKYCRNEYVARMDTDDVTVPDRMEKQIAMLEADPELSVVGSNMAEFISDVSNVIGYRNVPESHEEICKYLKSRCPLNHITVTLRKSHVERAGGYLHWHFNEDSYLWVRMYLAGCKFYNIQEVQAYARVGKEMYQRRGGYKYYQSEKNLFRFMYKNKVIRFFAYQKAKVIRFIVQVLMPNGVRQWFFENFAREKKQNGGNGNSNDKKV